MNPVMNFSPATWQLIVTFTPCTVLTVLPISTVTVGFSVLTTDIRDVFTSGFPENEKIRDVMTVAVELRHSLEAEANQ